MTFDLPWGRLAAKTWGRASGGIELVYNNVSTREGQWTPLICFEYKESLVP